MARRRAAARPKTIPALTEAYSRAGDALRAAKEGHCGVAVRHLTKAYEGLGYGEAKMGTKATPQFRSTKTQVGDVYERVFASCFRGKF